MKIKREMAQEYYHSTNPKAEPTTIEHSTGDYIIEIERHEWRYLFVIMALGSKHTNRFDWSRGGKMKWSDPMFETIPYDALAKNCVKLADELLKQLERTNVPSTSDQCVNRKDADINNS